MKIALLALASIVLSSNAFAWGSKDEQQTWQKVICANVGRDFGKQSTDEMEKAIERERNGKKVKSVSNLTVVPATVIPAYTQPGSSIGPQIINSAQICAVVTFNI